MTFKILCWLGKKLGWGFLPMCKVEIDGGTCILRNDAWVICKDKEGNTYDMLPLTLVSESLVEKFVEELSK